MNKKIMPLLSILVLVSSMAIVFSVIAKDDKPLTTQEAVAQALFETKNALKALADNNSGEATLALEKSIEKLENIAGQLNNLPVSKVDDIHSLLGVDLFNEPFDANSWNPLQEMQAMQNQMNQLFGHAFGRFDNSVNFNHLFNEKGFSPSMNLVEEDKQFVVTVDLPGANKDDVEIILKDQTLTVKGSTIEEKETKDEQHRVFKRERFSGRFSRTITLPAPINATGMESKINNGVLEITIPKA